MHRTEQEKSEILRQTVQTVHRLRAPGGCPWDREQTHQSLRQYLVEEAYETIDILDQVDSPEKLQDERLREGLKEELGDVLLQVLLHAEIASESGAFDVYDVAQSLNRKMVRRHPHVFGDARAETSDEVLRNWEQLKAQEKAARASVLEGVPKGLPALQRAVRVLEKVTRVGFQWKDMEGPLAKVDEELAELKAEVQAFEKAPADETVRERVEAELGDLFFTLCNLAFLTQVSPEDALRKTLRRFETRFRHVELRLKQEGKKPEEVSLQEMDRHWDEAKSLEKINE